MQPKKKKGSKSAKAGKAKKGGKKSGKGKKRGKSAPAAGGGEGTAEKGPVDILSPVAMENLYYVVHNGVQALEMRGFGWGSGGGGGGGKKKKGKKKKKK